MSTGAPTRAGAVPIALVLLLVGAAAPGSWVGSSVPWGADGHRMAARAAVDGLPRQVPGFFLRAGERLAWLGPEPDRWKLREYREMDQAWRYDHYVDLENIPPDSRALEAPHRYAFVRTLIRDGVDRPETDVGFLPFAIVELQQRLTSLWTRWHDAEDPREREFLEARILDDAGILGHYVTDASQPHHTTVHFDGWNAGRGASAPNPEGFTTRRGLHGRFETAFVSAHVRAGSVAAGVPDRARSLGDAEAVRSRAPAPEARAFAEARLAAGAAMLRDLWWTAFVEGRAAAGG